MCKYANMITDPDRIRFEVEKAIHIASEGRPGPVWLDIPLDVQGAYIDVEKCLPYPNRPNMHIKKENNRS